MNCSDKYSDIFGKNISSEVNKYLLSIGTFFFTKPAILLLQNMHTKKKTIIYKNVRNQNLQFSRYTGKIINYYPVRRSDDLLNGKL